MRVGPGRMRGGSGRTGGGCGEDQGGSGRIGEDAGREKFIVFSALCFASPAACCWCRDSCCLFLEMKSFCFDEIQPLQVTPG